MMRPLPLRRYLAFASTCGIAAERLLQGTALEPQALQDPQLLLDAASYHRIIDNLLDATGDTGTGLDVGLAREVSDFRIMGYAAMACRTVRQSVEEIWYQYGDALGMMAKIQISPASNEALALDIQAAAPSARLHRFFIEETLLLLVKVGAQVSGRAPTFDALELPFAAPSYAARYRALFDCPIRFASPHCRVIVNAAWLDSPVPTADEELRLMYRRSLAELKHEIENSASTAQRLQNLLDKHGNQPPSLDEAAAALELSARSLRRKLQEEGTSYRRIVQSHRSRLVLELLRQGQHSTKQLALLAGFDDTNAFRRAFKQWTGLTIAQACAQPLAALPPPRAG